MNPLTPSAARALRNADTLCFDTDQIRAITRDENLLDGVTTTVPVDHTVLDYRGHLTTYNCFHHEPSVQYVPHMVTMLRMVRAGATINLRWVRNNASPLTDRAGLVVDQLFVDLRSRDATITNSYLIRTQVSLDNSSRMIRPAH